MSTRPDPERGAAEIDIGRRHRLGVVLDSCFERDACLRGRKLGALRSAEQARKYSLNKRDKNNPRNDADMKSCAVYR